MPANTPEGSPEARAWLAGMTDLLDHEQINALAPELDALVEQVADAAFVGGRSPRRWPEVLAEARRAGLR